MTGNITQSTYSRYAPIAQNGTVASMSSWDADTYVAEGTIPFGLVVSKGAEDNTCAKAGTLFVGVSVRDVTLTHSTADQYQVGDNVAVLTRGDIWVVAKEAVVARTAVKYDTSTGELGKAAGTAISGAVWMTTADVGGLAICRLEGVAGDLTT